MLVVDDDGASLEATRTMLSLSGYEVRSANNGALGLEEALTFRPDVILFDFWMPVADGRELLLGIREVMPGRPALVAMSGTPEVEDWCARVGVSQFLRKPFDRHELVDAVRRAIEDTKTASGRLRVPSSRPTPMRLPLDRAVMLVGPRDVVRPIRSALRENEQPMQVASVEGVDDAVRALSSFRLSAIAVLAVTNDDRLADLVVEASARGLPIVLDRPSNLDLPGGGLHVSSSSEPGVVVELLQQLVSRDR